MSGSGREVCRMSGSGRVALRDVQEWSGGPPGSRAVVVRPYQMSVSCREFLPEVQKWTGGPPGCSG